MSSHPSHVGKPLNQKPQQLTAPLFISSEDWKASAFPTDCTLWIGCAWSARNLCELCAGLSSMVLPLSWRGCQGGTCTHLMCKGKILQVGSGWEEGELLF